MRRSPKWYIFFLFSDEMKISKNIFLINFMTFA
jgi:hypothetical protein